MNSPCTRVCKLDSLRTFCLGCGRTVEEITDWSRATEARRLEILGRLKASPGSTALLMELQDL